MADWFLNLPVAWMALIVFAAIFLIAGGVYLVVTRLADTEWARAFKAVSPGLLPVLGVLFALLVGFIAVEVWSTFDKAKTAVATEASALRAVVLLARNFPEEQRTRIDALIKSHIEVAVQQEWPEMAHQRATLSPLATHLIEALDNTIALKPADESQQTAKPEVIRALRTALDGRRQRIVITSLPWAQLNGQRFCFRHCAPWLPLPWSTLTTGVRAR